jgi:uncharacterized protein with HEPN domain
LKGDAFYLSHIVETIDRIERYCALGERDFLANELVQDAVLRNLQVMAESSQHISPEMKQRRPEIDWRGLSGFRNVLVHDYLGVNIARIWRIVSVDLPVLKANVISIRDLGGQGL